MFSNAGTQESDKILQWGQVSHLPALRRLQPRSLLLAVVLVLALCLALAEISTGDKDQCAGCKSIERSGRKIKIAARCISPSLLDMSAGLVVVLSVQDSVNMRRDPVRGGLECTTGRIRFMKWRLKQISPIY